MDPTTATTATSSASPTTDVITQGMNDSINNSKPRQLYIYPSVAVIIFLLAGIHICRFFDSQRMARRRLQERQAFEEAALDRWRRAAGWSRVGGELHAPRMFTAVLRDSEDDERRLGSCSWSDLLPISANIKKPPKPPPPIPSSPPHTTSSPSTLQKLKLGTNRTVCAFWNSFNFVLRRQPPQSPPDPLRSPAHSPTISNSSATAQLNQPEYVYRPQTLVTGILIAMPNSRRPFHPTSSSSSSSPALSNHDLQRPIFIDSLSDPPPGAEEELPEVALGYTETDWSRYGKPGDEDLDDDEPKEFKSSIISPSLEGVLFDRPW